MDLTVNGPFNLLQALRFLNEFQPAGVPHQHGRYQAAHVLVPGGPPFLVELSQVRPQDLTLSLHGGVPDEVTWRRAQEVVGRIFSLDRDSTPFFGRVAARDAVLARLQARYPGLRPVQFGSLFECLCWVLVAQRQSLRDAVAVKARLKRLLGPSLVVHGERWQAFPGPDVLARLNPQRDGTALMMAEERLSQLVALSRRGADGELDEGRLLRMPLDEACRWLAQSPGVGLGWAEYALVWGAGHPDCFQYRVAGAGGSATGDRQLAAAMERYYGKLLPVGGVTRLLQSWAGYRSWVAFLLRVAYQREAADHASREMYV